jgi:hypothetical protein
MKRQLLMSCCIAICFLLSCHLALAHPAMASEPKQQSKKTAKKTIPVTDGFDKFALDFQSIQKEKDFLDDPYEFSSAEAEELWRFLVSKDPYLDKLREKGGYLGSYARLVSDGYLIERYAHYFARPKQGILIQLTGNLDDYDPVKLRKNCDGTYWALVHGVMYRDGILYEDFYNFVFDRQPDASVIIRSFSIISFTRHGADEAMCENPMDPAEGYTGVEVATFVDKYEIRDANHDGKEDIIFYVTEQDCKTKVIRRRELVFLRVESCFIEKGVTKPSDKQVCKEARWP